MFIVMPCRTRNPLPGLTSFATLYASLGVITSPGLTCARAGGAPAPKARHSSISSMSRPAHMAPPQRISPPLALFALTSTVIKSPPRASLTDRILGDPPFAVCVHHRHHHFDRGLLVGKGGVILNHHVFAVGRARHGSQILDGAEFAVHH